MPVRSQPGRRRKSSLLAAHRRMPDANVYAASNVSLGSGEEKIEEVIGFEFAEESNVRVCVNYLGTPVSLSFHAGGERVLTG